MSWETLVHTRPELVGVNKTFITTPLNSAIASAEMIELE